MQTHTYDELSRLTSEQSQQAGQTVSTNSYQYDNVGNRLKSTLVIPGSPYITSITNYRYNNADWLTGSDVNGRAIHTAYSYDHNGNLQYETYTGADTFSSYVTSYGYDARNRLSSWQKTGVAPVVQPPLVTTGQITALDELQQQQHHILARYQCWLARGSTGN